MSSSGPWAKAAGDHGEDRLAAFQVVGVGGQHVATEGGQVGPLAGLDGAADPLLAGQDPASQGEHLEGHREPEALAGPVVVDGRGHPVPGVQGGDAGVGGAAGGHAAPPQVGERVHALGPAGAEAAGVHAVGPAPGGVEGRLHAGRQPQLGHPVGPVGAEQLDVLDPVSAAPEGGRPDRLHRPAGAAQRLADGYVADGVDAHLDPGLAGPHVQLGRLAVVVVQHSTGVGQVLIRAGEGGGVGAERPVEEQVAAHLGQLAVGHILEVQVAPVADDLDGQGLDPVEQQLEVAPAGDVGAGHLVDAGHPAPGRLAEGGVLGGQQGGRGQGGQGEPAGQVVGVAPGHPGGLAGLVAGAAGRLQGPRVAEHVKGGQALVAVDPRQVDRAAAGRCGQVGRRGQLGALEAGLVVAVAPEQAARPVPGRGRPDPVQQLGHRAGRVQVGAVVGQAGGGQVHVGVDEPGHQGGVAQVDHLVGAEGGHLGGRDDRGDAPALDGHGQVEPAAEGVAEAVAGVVEAGPGRAPDGVGDDREAGHGLRNLGVVRLAV